MRKDAFYSVLAVQDHVETFALYLFGHAQAHHHIDHLQQEKADHARIDIGRRHGAKGKALCAQRSRDTLKNYNSSRTFSARFGKNFAHTPGEYSSIIC